MAAVRLIPKACWLTKYQIPFVNVYHGEEPKCRNIYIE